METALSPETPLPGTEENRGPAEQAQVSRRRLFKLLGVAGAAALAAPLAPTLLRQASGAGPDQKPQGKDHIPQWAMVFDLRKCEGCVTQDKAPQCTEACNAEHFVPSGQNWIKVFEVEGAAGHTYFMPRPCMQCENPPCVRVCPVGATYRTEEGITLVDHRKCIGCRMCMAACPYGVRSFNWAEPARPAGAVFSRYSPEYPVPHRRGTVEKCMLCAHKVADGKLPACVERCPMNAIYLGDLSRDIASNGKDLVKLADFLAEHNAFRLKEELGTRPRVWYLPGHGQDYGHDANEKRPLQKPRSWLELGSTLENPHGEHR